MFINHNRKNDSTFIVLNAVLILLFLAIALISLYLTSTSNLVLYKLFLNIIVIVASFICIFILVNVSSAMRILRDKKTPLFLRRVVRRSIGFVFTSTIHVCELFGVKKDGVRAVFSDLNNKLILAENMKVKPEEILILLPHCLQNSKCPHKITTNIYNCKKCGMCDVDKLIKIQEKYRTSMYIATGGTLARKIILDIKPKAIIAVACERDLTSGILDTKGLPVMGIINDRPEGPCYNTKVDVNRVEETIKFFIGQGVK